MFVKSIPPIRPVLLLLDGHSSHYNPEAIKLAAEEEVIIFCLPPHTTHVAQPLDVSFFGPLKRNWSKVCHTYLAENPGKVVTKFQFTSLFAKAWYQTIKPETIVSGFRRVGVCPYNSDAIRPYSSSVDSEMEKPNEEQGDHRPVAEEHSSTLSTTDLENITDDDVPNSDHRTQKFTLEQISLFGSRYKNKYDLYSDSSYVAWLQLEHPNSLPHDLLTPDMQAGQQSTPSHSPNLSESVENSSGYNTPSCSASKSLSDTRKLLSTLSEFLIHPETPNSNKKGKKKQHVFLRAKNP